MSRWQAWLALGLLFGLHVKVNLIEGHTGPSTVFLFGCFFGCVIVTFIEFVRWVDK